jgi:CubicO group peptidase (beta-lactamase class C family)
MKPFPFSFRAVFFLAVVCWLGVPRTHAVPWVERHGMTGAGWQAEFDFWTAAPYRYRPTRVSGSESSGQARYTAILEKSSKTTDWAAVHGADAPGFLDTHNSLHAAGYRLIWLDGFGVGSIAYYNGIWEQNGGAVQQVALGQTLAAHYNTGSAKEAQGYHLTDLCAFGVNGAAFYGGVWTLGTVPNMHFHYNETGVEYQNTFNTESYGLVRVNGVTVGGVERFTSVWRQGFGSEGWSSHGMNDQWFTALNLNAQYQGYRPTFIDAYNNGTQTHYNATWVRNGGLSTSRLNTINTAVQNYIDTRGIPGLSLAIARQGRLVYARGFGYADTGTGEPAHPLHRWRIASVSKPVCAVAVLRALEDSAAWSLNSTLFGSGALFGTDYGTTAYSTNEKALTTRQLLNHTSGWPHDGKLWYDDEPSWGGGHDQVIGYQLDSVPPAFAPGTTYNYSNIEYVTAARVPERITGKTFAAYTKEQVFDPCGITSMVVGGRTLAEQKSNEVVYYPNPAPNNYDPYLIHPGRMDGSTAWIAKPSDLLLLGRRIDNDPRHRDLLGAYAMSQMRLANNQPDIDNGMTPSAYGMGWYPGTRNGFQWWGHNGSMAGSKSYLVVSDGDYSFAYACNKVGTSDTFSGTFANLVLDFMDDIDDANAWPAIDLFETYNPEYDAWATAAFGSVVTSKIGVVDVWAPTADPDEDGRSNALEAYLGSDPTVPDRSPWVLTYLSDTHLVLRWVKKNGYRGVEVQPQWGGDLQTWSNTADDVINRNDLITVIGHTVQEAQVARSTAKMRFLRLSLTTP